jgi:hypothetical protein
VTIATVVSPGCALDELAADLLRWGGEVFLRESPGVLATDFFERGMWEIIEPQSRSFSFPVRGAPESQNF